MVVVYGVFFSCFGPSVKYIFFMEGVHMFKQYEMELAGRTLRVDIGRVCAQANGAALMHMVILLFFQQQQHLKNQEKELISSR